jgi:hypothetical protein
MIQNQSQVVNRFLLGEARKAKADIDQLALT